MGLAWVYRVICFLKERNEDGWTCKSLTGCVLDGSVITQLAGFSHLEKE